MLNNRQNQVAAVQIAARRNLDVASLVAGRMHLSFGSKHRLYGKRPTSPWLPLPVAPVGVVVGSGTGDTDCPRTYITSSMASMCRYESERQRQLAMQYMAPTTLRIPAPAWAAFAIQRALQG